MSCSSESVLELPAWRRSVADEWINAGTHAVGCLLALAGAWWLAGLALDTGDWRTVLGCGVYLVSLIGVYLMSTLSHCARSTKWKARFRQLDQGAIFLLIVATYTPFSITFLTGGVWWSLLGTMWAVALWGFVSKVFYAHRVELVSLTPYVVLGWLPILAAPTLIQTVPIAIFWWMLAGGVCYTVGTLFLLFDQRVRHFHAIWHLCVIAGSACHFCGIFVMLSEASGA